MLNKLYKKLNIIFIIGIIIIMSVIFAILLNNKVNSKKRAEIILFQRLSTLIILQLENNSEDFKQDIKAYEEEYPIFCLLKDDFGKNIYQSPSDFPTQPEILLDYFEWEIRSKEEITSLKENASTIQEGIFEIQIKNNELYWAIPAIIISKDNMIYSMILIYKPQTTYELVCKESSFYILIWFLTLICVILLSMIVLRKAFEPTYLVLKSQREFVACASHELKSPLALILTNVEKLSKLNIDSIELNKSIKILDMECMYMSRLINDMLLLASCDAKTWSLNKKEINIDTLLISLYETYESVCLSHNISLEMNISDISYPVLYSDSERITQVLNVFMDNALYHSQNTSVIQIKTSLTAKTITFYVIDHGRGISEHDKPYVFDRFYSSDKSHTDKSHFGLGLSVAFEITKLLNGKIGVKDTEGGGATFYITIPLK